MLMDKNYWNSAWSGDNLTDRSADFNVQPLLAGNNQPLRIEPELMKHSSVNVRHIVPVLHGVVAQLIRHAMRQAALQSATRHPDRESLGMMVPAGSSLPAGRPAELGH